MSWTSSKPSTPFGTSQKNRKFVSFFGVYSEVLRSDIDLGVKLTCLSHSVIFSDPWETIQQLR
jgi:hypothetical protein